jgi:flagellar M-ring protein FliF
VNFETLLAKLKTLRAAFTPWQIASLVGTFLLVVAIIAGAARWLNTPSYRVLFADMDPESAARVTNRLRAQDVAYQLADGGRSVLVPESKLDQLRLDFAAEGLPATGRLGFELFDRTQFGATEFLEHVNFRRALEGELARTIASLSEVASARVHIAMAKDSLFGQREQPAKASVVLKLKSNRPLATSTTQAIVALMAASVEGLRPEAVVIVDSFGRPLARPGADDDQPLGAAQVERQERFERELSTRVVGLLEPVVGDGRVRANVAAHLHLDSEDTLQEKWDAAPVIRSRATTMEGPGAANATQGVAGARANLPGPVAPGTNEPAPTTLAQATTAPAAFGITNPVRLTETVNNELGKIVTHTTRPAGGVARLSVAVIVDDVHYVEKDKNGNEAPKTRPRDPAEIQKLHLLVAAAVGMDTTRGDQLTVENIAFDEPVPQVMPTPGLVERYSPQLLEFLKIVAVLALGGLAFYFVGRPLMRRVLLDAQPVDDVSLPRQLPKTIEELEGEIAAQLEAGAIRDRRLPVLTKRLSGLTEKEPEVAARLVRAWLAQDRS